MKNKAINIMLALDATCFVGRQTATVTTINPVAVSATHGVLYFFEISANAGESIRSLPSAYDARVPEYIVAFNAEVEENITARVTTRLPMNLLGMSMATD
jgi:hypothetical protein